LAKRASTDPIFGFGAPSSGISPTSDAVITRFRAAVWPVAAVLAEQDRAAHSEGLRFFVCNFTFGTPAPWEHRIGDRYLAPAEDYDCTVWRVSELCAAGPAEVERMVLEHLTALRDFVVATLRAGDADGNNT
jgi:hypothetical protein